jgi:hypothetical protein
VFVEAAHRQASFLHQFRNSEPREALFSESLGGNGNDALMSSRFLSFGIAYVSLHRNKLQLNQDYESNPVNGLYQ